MAYAQKEAPFGEPLLLWATFGTTLLPRQALPIMMLRIAMLFGDRGLEVTVSEGSLSAAFGAILALVGALVGAAADYQLRSRDLDIKMIDVAIAVLKSDCVHEPGLVPARKWAVDIVGRFSPVPMGADAKLALTENSIRGADFISDFSNDFATVARSACSPGGQQP